MDYFEEHKFWHGRHELACVLFDVAFENGDKEKMDAALAQMDQCSARMKACTPLEIIKERQERKASEYAAAKKELEQQGWL